MDRQCDFDDKYCYIGTNVLRNKLDIRNATDLYKAERDITSVSLAGIMANPIKGSLDFNHLKKIHYHIFKDIYDWAGEIRKVNISKGNMFCLYENIDSYGNYVFQKLKEENYLINTKNDVIFDRFSFFMSEINALHPFREGNGRSQRMFMSYLANVAGYELNFKKVPSDEMIKLSSLAFRNGHEEYIDMFEKIVTPISKQKQIDFISSIGLSSKMTNKKTLEGIKQEIDRYKNDTKNHKSKNNSIKKYRER